MVTTQALETCQIQNSVPPGCFRGEYGSVILWDGLPNQTQIKSFGRSVCRQSLYWYYVKVNRRGVDVIGM